MVRNSTAGRNYEFLLFSSRSKLTCRTNNFKPWCLKVRSGLDQLYVRNMTALTYS